MENIEVYLLILVAILEIVDGQGIALRVLRLLMRMIGAQPDGKETRQKETSPKN
jgi:hypothetical protein